MKYILIFWYIKSYFLHWLDWHVTWIRACCGYRMVPFTIFILHWTKILHGSIYISKINDTVEKDSMLHYRWHFSNTVTLYIFELLSMYFFVLIFFIVFLWQIYSHSLTSQVIIITTVAINYLELFKGILMKRHIA